MAMTVSSALRAVDLRQEPAPLIIGERLNAQGSRRAKRLVLEDDIGGLVDLAREQADDGAHCIDVCVDTTERSDEREMMVRLVKRLSLEVEAPLVIDSTSADVVAAAVEQVPGRPVINSINLEGDGSRFGAIAPVMAKYGVPAVAMCIGPDGMARTPREKLDTARLLLSRGREAGLSPDQFVFDVLTFTLGTGEAEYAGAGADTLEGIRMVREEMPDSYTVLGLSNVSFGLTPPARRLLNSVFLHHAVRAGLDAVIVNVRDITAYAQVPDSERRLAEALIFNESDAALPELIAHFEGAGGGGARAARAPAVDPSMSASRRCTFRIVNRVRDGIEGDVLAAIAEKVPGTPAPAGGALGLGAQEAHDAALRTLNDDLLPAMKEVGDRFGAGEIILPFVLKSAECMKAAVAELERHLIRADEASKGTIVLGTVYGDVHDIGKNLVKTILENNGYTVHDLGKQVPLQRFVDKVRETRADAVGLSALLVHTSRQMGEFVERARRDGLGIPILCGGAAIHTNFVNKIASEGGIYPHGVFYCNTMFDGLAVMEEIAAGRREELVAKWRGRLERWRPPAAPQRRSDGARRSVEPVAAPSAPSTGEVTRLGPADVPLGEVWPLLDKKSLFKLSWGVRGRAAAASEAEHERLYDEWRGRAVADGLIEPRVAYAYYACRNAGGGRLEVDAGGGRTVEFEFPQRGGVGISDYFGGRDIVAFQAVTVGPRAAQETEAWNAEGRYTDAYYLHGLAVEAAEALAAWAHARIRAELGIGARGLRYSWGYPSCPDISQHRLVWGLLRPEESGMTLTSHHQIVPEHSTAAIVVHHPDASY